MARVKNGVNGSVSGKVGPSVFCTWKGIDYVRSLPRVKKNRRPTAAQGRNQSRFKFMQGCLSTIVPVVRLGFMQYAPNQTAHNSAMSYNLRESVIIEDGNYRLNYEKFAISRGLPSPVSSAEIYQEKGQVLVRWKLDPVLKRDYSDMLLRCILLLYADSNTDFHEAAGELLGNAMLDGEQTVQVGYSKDITAYHVYLAFVACDGSNQSTDSIYLGKIAEENA